MRRADSLTTDLPPLLRLLGRAWLLEPDRVTLERLAVLPPLGEAVRDLTPDGAALEYSRVVLQLVPPYASLFLDEDAMLNGVSAERAQVEYARYGFEIRPEWRAGPADHLGLELLFLAHLIEGERPEWRAFLDQQVLPWAPVCCLAVERVRDARLYPAVAGVTRATLLTAGAQ